MAKSDSNSNSVIKEIIKDCNYAIIKMIITVSSFAVACILIRVTDFNEHANNAIISFCILVSFFFPAVSTLKVVMTLGEIVITVFAKHKDVKETIFSILCAKYSLRQDVPWYMRFACRVPFIGRIVSDNIGNRRDEIVIIILKKTIYSIIVVIICYVLFLKIIKPVIIYNAIGKRPLEMFIYYIKMLYNYMFSK